MVRSRKTAGISLIALVITIIVLLILTAAVVVTFREGGIIDRAKEAVFKNDIQTYKEVLLIKNAENVIDKSMGEEVEELNAATTEEIQAIIPEFKEEYEGIVEILNGELVLGSSVQGEEIADEYVLYVDWLTELGIVATEDDAEEEDEINWDTNPMTLAEATAAGYAMTLLDDGTYSITGFSGTETDIILPSSIDGTRVTIIGTSAFNTCLDLTNVSIPSSITTIEASAFSTCLGLTSIIIPEGVTSIGENAFCVCQGLTNVEIADTVTTIESYAFEECDKIASITIPNSVTSIGERVFGACNILVDINYTGTKDEWNSFTLDSNWDSGLATDYTIHCTDGDIVKES